MVGDRDPTSNESFIPYNCSILVGIFVRKKKNNFERNRLRADAHYLGSARKGCIPSGRGGGRDESGFGAGCEDAILAIILYFPGFTPLTNTTAWRQSKNDIKNELGGLKIPLYVPRTKLNKTHTAHAWPPENPC